MKTVREMGFGGLPGFTDDGGSWLPVVAHGGFPLLFLASVPPLSLSLLVPCPLPSLFSHFPWLMCVDTVHGCEGEAGWLRVS